MTNADKFKNIFGLYATELWSMPEKDFLKWLNSEAMNCSEFPNNSDTISRQAAVDVLARFLSNREGGNAVWWKPVAESVINVLPSAEPEQRWIPFGRPMNSGMYLVTLRQKFEGKETYRVRIIRLNNGHWVLPKHFPEWINEEMEQEVLAWMPLPEPYTERREE